MQFSGHATSQDLVSDTKFLCGIPSADTTSYLIADITRAMNFALDKVFTLIWKSNKKWKYDDNNQTDLPISTTTLVDDQRDYSIPVTDLDIVRLRILSSNGTNYYTLTPARREDLTDWELDEIKGIPRKYVKIGSSILLYPAADTTQVTAASGFEVQFKRPVSYFVTTDTTKVPGFNSEFHRLISLYAAKDYCSVNSPTKLPAILEEINKLEAELVKSGQGRGEDEKSRMSMRDVSSR